MSAWSAFLLGAIQGITEWVPVSSSGIVSVVSMWVGTTSTSDAIGIALWLHVGTAMSAAGALRGEITQLVREVAATPRSLPRTTVFLFLSTFVTGVIGVPLFLLLGEVANQFGAGVMVVIGVAMIGTAWLIRRRAIAGERDRTTLGTMDALLAGTAQGLAVIPGLSRMGLTVAALLSRGYDHREAMVLSVLMGIPASLGAGILAIFSSDTELGLPAVIGLVTASVVGMAAIRAVLAWASQVKLAPFVAVMGGVAVAGAILDLSR